MKARKETEKIYVCIPDGGIIGTASTRKGFPHQFVTEEYTRTDAFIEKAEKAMIEWAGTYISKTTGGGVRERKELATDLLNYFKKYMKGE